LLDQFVSSFARANVLAIFEFDADGFVARTRLLRWFDGGSDDTALRPLRLLKIRSVRILDTIVCSGPLVWLLSLSPAWDAFKLTQESGFICPFVVVDPTD
jgi:hypothetical protein